MQILYELNSSLNREIREKIKKLEETGKINVIPIFSEIHRGLVDSLSAFLKNRESKKELHENTYVILHSPGGDADAAYHLGVILSDFTKGKLIFIVPRWAKSAATLLALSGDQILMFDVAELGPLDPQIIRRGKRPVSALALKAMLDLLNAQSREGNMQTVEVLAKGLDPLDLGELDRTLGISRKYATALLVKRMFKGLAETDPKVAEIAETLTKKYPHHGYLIELSEAKRLGLLASAPDSELRQQIQEIFDLEIRVLEVLEIDKKLQEYDFIKQKG